MARGRSRSGPSMSSRARDAVSSHRAGSIGLPPGPSAASASSSSAITSARDDSVIVATRCRPNAARANSAVSPAARARSGGSEERGSCVPAVPVRRSASPYSHNIPRPAAGRPPATSTARRRCPAASSKAIRAVASCAASISAATALTRSPSGSAMYGGRRSAPPGPPSPHHAPAVPPRQVQRRPPGRGQPLVDDLAEQVVAEAAAARRVLLDDAARTAMSTRGIAVSAGTPAMAATAAIANRLPADRGDGEQVHDLPGRRARRRVSTSPTARGTPVTWARSRGDALRREQPRALLGEKRIARGALVHVPASGAGGRSPQTFFGSWPTSLAVSPASCISPAWPASSASSARAGCSPSHHLHVPVGPDHQRGAVVELADQEQRAAAATRCRPSADRRGRPPAAAAHRSFAQVGRCRVVGAETYRGLVAEDAVARLVRTRQPGENRFALPPPSRASARTPGSTASSPARPRPPSTSPTRRPRRVPSRTPPLRRQRGLTHAGLAREEYDPARAGLAASAAERSASTVSCLPTSTSAGTPHCGGKMGHPPRTWPGLQRHSTHDPNRYCSPSSADLCPPTSTLRPTTSSPS